MKIFAVFLFFAIHKFDNIAEILRIWDESRMPGIETHTLVESGTLDRVCYSMIEPCALYILVI